VLSQRGEIAMSEKTEEPEPPEMVEVTVRVPSRVLAEYDGDVSAGIYASRDEALRQGLVESWRYHRGRYSTLRIELRVPADKRPDTDETPEVMDVLAAGESLKGEPEGGAG